jgi:hypothetical protein
MNNHRTATGTLWLGLIVLAGCHDGFERQNLLHLPDPGEVTATTALAKGVVVDAAGAITEHGFCWRAGDDTPVIGDPNTARLGAKTGRGEFSYLITRLERGKRYSLRAFVITEKGTRYSPVVAFDTGNEITAKELSGVSSSNITDTTALARSTVSVLGTSSVVEHGHCWAEGENAVPAFGEHNAQQTRKGELTRPGEFESTLTRLKPGTWYSVRAYLILKSDPGRILYSTTDQFRTGDW